MLQIVFAEHAVTRCRRVTRQLLVFLEHVLSVAADLGPLWTVRVECAIGVLRLRLAAAATTAAAAAISTALTLHAFEISHYLITVSISLRPDFVLVGLR